MQFRATSSRESGRGGITLVELLVVIAIIGLLASVSVPFAMRMGLVPSRKVDAGARDLFQMLRAARIHATNNNVDTAVAYTLAAPIDSVSGAGAPVLDGVALVRKLKPAELDAEMVDFNNTPIYYIADERMTLRHALALFARSLELGETLVASFPQSVFVPVRAPEGVFRPLSNNTCVLPGTLLDPSNPLSSIQIVDLDTVTNIIRDPDIYDVNNKRLNPELISIPSRLFEDPPSDILVRQRLVFAEGVVLPNDLIARFQLDRLTPTHFPAHVFRPSGALVSNSPKQRVVLSIGLLPDADPGDRFNLDQNGNPAGEISAQVELYTAQGRVKIVS